MIANLGIDVLYRLTTRDMTDAHIEAVTLQASATGATSVLIPAFQPIANDKVLLVSRLYVVCQGGAAQNVEDCRMRFNPNPVSGTGFEIEIERFAGTRTLEFGQFKDFLVPSNYELDVAVNFSAGAAPNLAVAYLFGFVIPRGTFLS